MSSEAGAAANFVVDFVTDMITHHVLQFGDFVLKSGRASPYFFNLAAIDDGAGLATLGRAYGRAVAALSPRPDVVFGPAYKGIPIAVASAVALAGDGVDVRVAYNRKEAKDHGEGGALVGAELAGRNVVVVDDVVTAGTAVREAVEQITAAGGRLTGVVVALDREELYEGDRTAVEVLSERLGVPVKSIASLSDVMVYLDNDSHYVDAREKMAEYRNTYCKAAAK